MSTLRSRIAGHVAFAVVAVTGSGAAAQSARTTPDAIFFQNLWVTRAPIGSIRDFPAGPNAPATILVNDADETSAINIIITRKTGTYTPEELTQIAEGMHLQDLAARFKAAAGIDGNARPATDPGFLTSLNPLLTHIMLSSPNVAASRQLQDLLLRYLPGGWTASVVRNSFVACNTVNEFKAYEARCPATSPEAPDPATYANTPIEVTLAKISEASYDTGFNGQIDGFYVLDHPIVGDYGFAALVMTRADDVVMAIRGTDLNEIGLAVRNLDADKSFVTGINTEFAMNLRQASELLARIHKLYPNAHVYVTGHSLGGAIAEILGRVTDLPTATYNAPGVAELGGPVVAQLIAALDGVQFANKGKIVNYRTDGDRVSLTGRQVGFVCTIAQSGPVSWGFADAIQINHKIRLIIEDLQNPALARYPDWVMPNQKMPPSVPCQTIN